MEVEVVGAAVRLRTFFRPHDDAFFERIGWSIHGARINSPHQVETPVGLFRPHDSRSPFRRP